MTLFETLRSGLEAITGHRLRSALTVLGILIGISAVILTVGLGEGASSSVDSAIASLGSNLLIVTPGSSTSSAGIQGGLGSATTLTYANAQDLASHLDCPDIVGVAPTATTVATVTAGIKNWTTSVVGTTPSWPGVRSRSVLFGSFFTAAQDKDQANVAVLGSTTASKLGLGLDPVGQTIDVDGVSLTVIGVLSSAGSLGSTDEDDMVLLPITLAQSQILGSNSVQTIYLKAASQGALGAAYQEADDELLSLHQISKAANADFTITSQQTIAATASSVDKTLTVLLAGIAAISLLVGGIGVMNIMLVSVTERVREIGLRKALGATPAAIRRQFLVEASVLGLTGGILGAGVGLLGAIVLPRFISNTIAIEWWAVVGAIAVAMAIGLIFGVYPAARAARLAPIEALRSE
ncbi:MAG: ABC transporter permease [Candidatus Dormiibacterota bacterium]